MPRETTTYDLRDVRAELDEQLDDLAEQAHNADGEERDTLLLNAQQCEAYLAGVEWAIAEFDNPTLTLGSLTAGEYAQVRDHTDAAQNRAAGDTDAAGARQLALAAAGVADAPFVPDDVPEGAGGFDDRREAVADLSPQFVEWLSAEVDDLSTPETSTRGFSERLAAAADREPNTN